MNALRLILNLLLLVGVLVLGFWLFKEIQGPIQFEHRKVVADNAAIEKLKLIRDAQIVYRSKYNKYANDFDTLKAVMLNEKLDQIKQIGDPNDTTVQARTIVHRISIVDSLFNGDRTAITTLEDVPGTNGVDFDIQAKIIDKSQMKIPAFEVSVPYKKLYRDIGDPKYYAEFKGRRLKVGDIAEGTTAGNWE